MLIKCPECGAEISKRAKTCPKCGNPMRVGFWGFVLGFFDSRLEGIRAKRAEDDLRKRVKAFSYSIMPYSRQYSHIDAEKVRRRMVAATNSKELEDGLQDFRDPYAGYLANLPWLKEAVDLFPDSDYFVTLVYAAHCFGDEELCRVYFPTSKHHFRKDFSVDVLNRFAKSITDAKTVSFIDKYVSFQEEFRKCYDEKIDWSKYILSQPINKSVIDFFQKRGLHPRIGDHDRVQIRHMSLVYGDSIYDFKTSLSEALDADDIERITFLLKWGASPNVFLGCGFSNQGRGKEGWHTDPLLFHIMSKEAFFLMDRAGMDWYPNRGQSAKYNLIEHLWHDHSKGMLSGKKLELLNHLYSIGYDKPLLNKIDEIRRFIREEGENHTHYGANLPFVVEWANRAGGM